MMKSDNGPVRIQEPFVRQGLMGMLLVILIGCSQRPVTPPPGVSKNATWIETPKEVYWLNCVPDPLTKEIRCQRWRQDGVLSYEAAYDPPEEFDWGHPTILSLAHMDIDENINLTDGRKLRFKRRVFPKEQQLNGADIEP